MDKKYTVYMHVNKINGKKYVGMTCQRLKKRFGHGSNYRKQPVFYSEILEYGWDGFEHLVIAEGLSKEEAELLEYTKVLEHKTIEREFGYNIDFGGNTLCGRVRKRTDETIRRMSEINKGRVVSEETRKKLTGRPKNAGAKPVLCVEMGIVFPSVKEAARSLKVADTHIYQACKGNQRKAYGYHWEFVI